ncbi:MAG: hypothetical protein OSJ65_03285 [Bacilli bacterium]|nr:hypothetical protein [Bacilli bacterium]
MEAIFINNKVFIKLLIPEIDKSYDISLPVNKRIGNIINLLSMAVSEMSNGELRPSKNNVLYNARTGEKYMPNTLLLNTNIRNGTILVLLTN